MYLMYVKIDGTWLSTLELQNGLHQINTDMKTRMNMNPMDHRVQILTSDVRSTWAMNRQKLIDGIYKTMTRPFESLMTKMNFLENSE